MSSTSLSQIQADKNVVVQCLWRQCRHVQCGFRRLLLSRFLQHAVRQCQQLHKPSGRVLHALGALRTLNRSDGGTCCLDRCLFAPFMFVISFILSALLHILDKVSISMRTKSDVECY